MGGARTGSNREEEIGGWLATNDLVKKRTGDERKGLSVVRRGID